MNSLKRHLDYIHYNPVKHGISGDAFEYAYTSLRHWQERGYYTRDWGKIDPVGNEGEFGE